MLKVVRKKLVSKDTKQYNTKLLININYTYLVHKGPLYKKVQFHLILFQIKYEFQLFFAANRIEQRRSKRDGKMTID